MRNKVICWDLHETLVMRLQEKGKSDPMIVMRKGIDETLSELSAEGYTHFVTAQAAYGSIIDALAVTDLLQYINGFFGWDKICGKNGKIYRPVAELFNLSDKEAASDMIVAGDGYRDMPTDIEGLVFIQHAISLNPPTDLTAAIIRKLRILGEDDFLQGFKCVYEHAPVQKRVYGDSTFYEKRVSMEGAELELEWRKLPDEDNGTQGRFPAIVYA